MNTTILRFSLSSIVFTGVLVLLPSFASAATSTISTRTVQLLPANEQTCTPMAVTSVTPYVYNGSLDSFDVVIQDASYVAIGGAVGNTVLPFRYMTRSMAANGQLRIHTDNDPAMVGQGTDVSLTFLSAQGGKVCASTVSFTVLPEASYPATPIVTPVVGATTGGSSSGGSTNEGAAAPVPVTPTTSAPTTTVSGSQTQAGFCDGRGAMGLWIILLLVYAAIVAAAALVQAPFIQKSPAIPVAMILVPLILLVGFWYFSPTCRAASWIPIVLLIIAIAGLLAAFRENKGGPLMLLTSRPLPMPIPAGKPQTSPALVEKKPATPATPVKLAPKASTPATSTNPHVQKIQEKLHQILGQDKKK